MAKLSGEFILVSEAEKLTGIPRQTIARAVKDGKIEGASIAQRLLIKLDKKFWEWVEKGYNREMARRVNVRWEKSVKKKLRQKGGISRK